MLLRQIVEINPKGSLRSSVNFDMMRDEKDNLALCEEFIFNYDKDKPTESTVGVLDALRSSFDGRGYANIHLMIQMYGKGKSHFAVAIANYFKQSADSAEVHAILKNIDDVAGKNSPVAERLHAFKKRGKHLVICLSGDKSGNLKKQFLEAVLHTLEQEKSITGTVAQRFCANPLKFLEELTKSEDDQAIAEAFLENHPTCNVSLQQLIRYLRDNKYEYVKLVKELSCGFTIGGFPLDFETDLDVQVILQDLIDTLCTGEERRFLGILILFDELNRYLRDWSSASTEAGGAILQNITNICENNKSRIALMSFAQYRPIEALINPREEDSYFQIASRLEPPDTTYRPASSLELVLDTLIIQRQETPEWQNFETRFESQLLAETRIAYEQRIRSYREKGIDRNWFHDHITIGCFPLHPLTAYLLCNLDFAQIQDRTAIGFLRGRVKLFIETQSVEKENERLNCIPAVDLIDEFIANFSSHSVYNKYKEAEELVIGSDDPDELTVLKGLLLYYVNKERLVKSDTEDHQEILANLTGLPRNRVEAALKKLMQVRDVIYYKAEEKSYRFHVGLSPTQVEQELVTRIKPQLKQVSANDVANYCLQKIDNQTNQTRIEKYIGSNVLSAKHFVDTNKLIPEEWRFEHKVFTIDGLIRELSNSKATTKEQGILANIVAETQQELQDLRHKIDQLLADSKIQQRIAVAIPVEETGNLAEVLLKIRTLRASGSEDRSSFGAAYESLLEQYEKEVDTRLTRLLKSYTLHSIKSHQIPQSERNNPQRVISDLLQSLYYSVPPMGSIQAIPQMRSGHSTGSTVIGYVAKHLLTNTLNPQIFPKQEYKTVVNQIFVDSWHLLQATSQKYSVQEPTHGNVRAAWNLISQIMELNDQKERIVRLEEIWKTLSAPPYGYNEYAFIILLSGWLTSHSKEVVLRGKPPGNKIALPITQSLKDWAETGFLEKARYFVSDWIVKGGASLIRRQHTTPKLPSPPIDYDQSTKYIQDVSEYLETAPDLDPTETADLKQRRDRVKTGVRQIDDWLKPIAQLERLIQTDSLDHLLQGYSNSLQPPSTSPVFPDGTTIYPTQEQRDRQSQVRQAVSNRIEALIPQYCDRLKSLTTETACLEYQQQTQQMIEQLNADEIFPAHWREPLQTSLQAIALRIAALKKQAEITERLTLIQSAKHRLTSNSNQQDYASVRQDVEQRISEIEALMAEVLAIDPTLSPTDAKTIYQPILESVITEQAAFIHQLETFQQQLTTLQTAKEAQQFQATLLGKSFQYRGSSSEEKYNIICTEAGLLLSLLTIVETSRTHTIAACDDVVHRLTEWQSSKEQELSSLIQNRLEVLLRGLAERKLQIQELQRIEAEKWLETVEQEYTKLTQTTDSHQQGEISRKLLKEIRSQAGQKAQILANSHKCSLKRIFDHCIAAQSDNIENQIITLFDRLSRPRRGKLLITLSKRLENPTEESHDG